MIGRVYSNAPGGTNVYVVVSRPHAGKRWMCVRLDDPLDGVWYFSALELSRKRRLA